LKSYFGTYHQPGAGPVESTVLVFDKMISIGYSKTDGSNQMLQWPLKDLTITTERSGDCTLLRHLQMQGELRINGTEAATHIQSLQEELQKPWIKRSSGRDWIRSTMVFLGIAGLLVLVYLLIVPWLSEKLASKVPAATEREMGDAVYNAMGMDTKEDKASSAVLNEFFKAMNIPSRYDIRISVVDDGVINAFALPGGRIVVYKPLLLQIRSYPELAALLSHEFTHINERHATKRIFRSLGSRIFISLLFGKFGAVTNVLVSQAENLKHLQYSRNLEKEADMEGLRILMERKIDPAGFTDLFKHLKNAAPGSALPEFLGSHPDTDKRMEYIQKAAPGAEIKEIEKLSAIFDQLKNTL